MLFIHEPSDACMARWRCCCFDKVATMEQSIISLKNVSYAYPHAAGDQRVALSDITLDIREGEFIGLVGANGSGKSTLVRMLNALLVPVSGEVRVEIGRAHV